MAEKSWLVITAESQAQTKKAWIELQWHADILKQQLVLKLLKHAFSYQDTTYLIASSIKAETGLLWRAGVSLLPAFPMPQREKRRCCFRERRRAITRGGQGFCLRSLGSLRTSGIPRTNVQTQDHFRITYIKDDIKLSSFAVPGRAAETVQRWASLPRGLRQLHNISINNTEKRTKQPPGGPERRQNVEKPVHEYKSAQICWLDT